jgi:4-hydroxy-tetrahydrodipicolinate synthase
MSQRRALEGIMVALATPFTEDGKHIDEANLRQQIERLIDAGVHGIVPAGSTGEFPTMTIAERQQLAEIAVDAVKGRISVTIGTGALSTAEAVELTRHAHDSGADAAMVVPPFYEGLTASELRGYLSAVSAAAPIPIEYYNIPGATGVKLSAAELAELARDTNFAYIKDTSGDAVGLSALLQRHSADVTVFNGWDTLTFFGLASGAKGSVWGAANFVPELAVELWNTIAVKGDLEAGRQLWARLWPIADFLESHNYVAGVKAGLALIGHSAGPTRAPIAALPDAEQDELRQLLVNSGVITA